MMEAEQARKPASQLSASGKASGILIGDEADGLRHIEWGYRFVATGTDIGRLAKNVGRLAASFKRI
jgi:4-hydroxy-2-oxoheptanedioate aldolase